MPEYLAPGVFVEETSFRAKSIEGVSTTTTGFVGAAAYGPVTIAPDIVTSLSEFELTYGGGTPLLYSGKTVPSPNFLWQAVRSFFAEGGKRLYVSRVFKPLSGDYAPVLAANELTIGKNAAGTYDDGHGRILLKDPETKNAILLRARHPGAAGNFRVRVTAKAGQNILGGTSAAPSLGALREKDLVWILDTTKANSDKGNIRFAVYDNSAKAWSFSDGKSGGTTALSSLDPAKNTVRVLTLSVTVSTASGGSEIGTWSGLRAEPAAPSTGLTDSLFVRFCADPASSADARNLPLVVAFDSTEIATPLDSVGTFFPPASGSDHQAGVLGLVFTGTSTTDAAAAATAAASAFTHGVWTEFLLSGGNDGAVPGTAEYEGKAEPTKSYSTGLKQFEEIEDISIVAAPGSNWDYATRKTDSDAIAGLLVAHAEYMRYRIAVLDAPHGQTISDIRAIRGKIDSKYAALYYPWVTVSDPVSRQPIDLPPSGFVAGIYARSDNERGVWKAPANEVVRTALGFESTIARAQQEVLNPEGINCFRFFEGRGNRLWGARTISSDPEWKYVNVRRYFAYLERSIDKGTQWAVFEPNGDLLWANVRRTISDFLLNEWQSGALLGDKPEKAFFVRCDRSTMTQNDLDNGRLVALVGVAPVKPAEFVIFRVGQWTADSRS